MILRRLPIFLACLALALAGCGERGLSERDRTVVVSIPSTGGDEDPAEAWAPLLTEMARATGLRVEPFVGSSDTALVEAMRFRQTDMGWFAPAAGLEAVRRAGGEVFARAVRLATPAGNRALLIVRKGSDIDLARVLACDHTLSFGLGEASTVEGDLAPSAYLFTPQALDPADCFDSTRNASLEANLYGVATGAVDAAVSDTASLSLFGGRTTAAGRPLDMVTAIWASPILPDDPLVWRKDLHPVVKDRITRFVFGYGVGQGREARRQREVLRGLGLLGFTRAGDGLLAPMREMEANQKLLQARARQDPAAIARAQAELDAAAAERIARPDA